MKPITIWFELFGRGRESLSTGVIIFNMFRTERVVFRIGISLV